MNSSNRSNTLRNSPTQYSRLLGSNHNNRNNHHLSSNSSRPNLLHHNRRVSDWVNCVQYGKDYLHQYNEVSSNSNAAGGFKAQVFPKQGGQISPSHSIFCNENITGITSDHQVTPPLHINICQESSVMSPNILNQSPTGLVPSNLDVRPRSTLNLEFSPRRSVTNELRLSPVQVQQSTSCYCPDDGRKSESPSRKRRRLSRGSHHQILELPSSPPPQRPLWDNRQVPFTRSRYSPSIRRSRYQNTFAHNPVVMDVNQVPVTLPLNITHSLSLYSPVPPNSSALLPNACQIYATPQFSVAPSHQYIAQQNPISLPQYPHIQSRDHPKIPGPQFLSQTNPLTLPSQYQHIQAPRGDPLELDYIADPRSNGMYHAQLHSVNHPPSPNLHHPLHPVVSGTPTTLHSHTPSPPMFLTESRGSPIEVLPQRTRRANISLRRHSRRWRGSAVPHPHPSTTPYLLHFIAMFSNPPLSPYSTDLNSPNPTEANENYEALLNLAERLGEAKPRGLFRAEIEQLPSYKFNVENHQSDQTCCVVCMCDFEARQSLRVLPCSHEFHAKCVDKWLKSNRTCPICRGDASQYFYTTSSSPSSSE